MQIYETILCIHHFLMHNLFTSHMQYQDLTYKHNDVIIIVLQQDTKIIIILVIQFIN